MKGQNENVILNSKIDLDVLIKNAYDQHYKELVSWIMSKTKDIALAEDLTQETFIKAIKAIKEGKYEEGGNMRSWLFRVGNNTFVDYYRRNSKKGKNTISLTDNSAELDNFLFILPETNLNQLEIIIHSESEKDLDINKLLEGLSTEQKEVIMLRHFHNFSFKEIAEYTGESINTCLGRMRYALKNMRIQLGLPAVIDNE